MTGSKGGASKASEAFWLLSGLLFLTLAWLMLIFTLRWGWLANTVLHGPSNHFFWIGHFASIISIVLLWVFYPSSLVVGLSYFGGFTFPYLIFGMPSQLELPGLVVAALCAIVAGLLARLLNLFRGDG